MADSLELRTSRPVDLPSIAILYPDAFPDEDLLPLVSELLRTEWIALSLAGIIGSPVVGHVVLTRCGNTRSSHEVVLLGSLAVALHGRTRTSVARWSVTACGGSQIPPLLAFMSWAIPPTISVSDLLVSSVSLHPTDCRKNGAKLGSLSASARGDVYVAASFRYHSPGSVHRFERRNNPGYECN